MTAHIWILRCMIYSAFRIYLFQEGLTSYPLRKMHPVYRFVEAYQSFIILRHKKLSLCWSHRYYVTGENLIILVIFFTYPVNHSIARSGISQFREFPLDRKEFSDYARLQNWKWIIPRNLPNRLFYAKQNILKLIFSKRLRFNTFEPIRTG